MKFVKENLTLVICGAVAVLFLVFALAPIPVVSIPALKAHLTADMQQRWQEQRNKIQNWKNKKIDLPGGPSMIGVPPQNWVDAKGKLINGMERMQREVDTMAKQYNARGRLDSRNVPMLPVVGQAIGAGTSMPGLLPRATRETMAFKTDYTNQFLRWTGFLATGRVTDMNPQGAMPPKYEELKADWDKQVAAANAQRAPGSMNPNLGIGSDKTQQERDNFKRLVMARAKELQMYVMDTAFQVRDWGYRAPNEEQMFEAFVDSWLQADVVRAIGAVNSAALPPPGSADRNVGLAPVKRLTRVVIGNDARTPYLGTSTAGAMAGVPPITATPTGDSSLFFRNTNANAVQGRIDMPEVPVEGGNRGAAAGGGGGKWVFPDTPNEPDYTLGMTGRSAGKTLDVVYMSVVMDIDPAYLFKFLEQLYMQNMSYTLTNFQMRTVDPLERASQGYIYGNTQVIEVELLIECVFFRSWTEPLMPDKIKEQLGAIQSN